MIRTAVRQPVTVAVGVLLILLAGVVAIQRIPIQLTPNVEDTIVSVQTFWEGASPYEVEQEIVDEQEDKLLGIANLRAVTSSSQQGIGSIRLEFKVGTPKAEALREVSDKLRQVPDYPDGADEPVIEASDPENRDYIAWVVLETTDPVLDIRDLLDFAADRLVPVFERIPGMAEVNALGGREREVQVRFDPVALAQRGITVDQLVARIRETNQNRSAGDVSEAKRDFRLRLVSQYQSVRQVEDTVIAETDAGPVRLGEVAEVFETFKEPRTFVRSRGQPVIAINYQREVGANVMEVMGGLQEELARMNEPGGILDREARRIGLDGGLKLTQVYDQTIYIDDALALVRNNIWIGGALATLVLLLFLRSVRGAGIVALAIPISAVGAVVVMVSLGRTVNVISLAGMAFAIGMVVDNAIVVLENVYRHLELGKRPFEAAVDGTSEVFGAILAATLTTVSVFVPILLIEEEAGQLFRDISLAIVAAVSLSLLVSVTVIPVSAARLLSERDEDDSRPAGGGRFAPSRLIGRFIHWMCGSTLARLAIVALFTVGSLWGTWMLLPPSDYLPTGNRNLFFGLMIPPPGYSLEQRSALAARIEEGMRPYWKAGQAQGDPEEYARRKAELPSVPTFDYATMQPGPPVTPPPLENYFVVALEDILFHGAISAEPERVADLAPLFQHATRGEVAPGVIAFGFQVPLFQLGGSTGSAVKINFVGDDLDEVSASALGVFMELMGRFGPGTTQPDPANFNVPGPELQVVPDLVRVAEAGLSPASLGLAVQAMGDGAIIGDYEIGGQTIDLKVVAVDGVPLSELADAAIATPAGGILPIGALAQLRRVNAPSQINRVSRQRSVTLQLTAPPGVPLEAAVDQVAEILGTRREAGAIPPTVQTSFTGSASKLDAVRVAMLGDGTAVGTISSSLVLALLVVYLLLCVLFQSFLRPAVILFSVPLATLGGFAALAGVHAWSQDDPYMPIQNLDVLTMLGFVILIGVVVNNAILIVHQALHFMRGTADSEEGLGVRMPARQAIAEATRTRVRPIFMGTLTSVGGMAPLVFMPGAGSELYRGLGSVVVGGLIVSTVFTLVLVPLLFSLLCDVQRWLGRLPEEAGPEEGERGGGGAPASLPAGASGVAGLLLALTALFVAGCRTSTPSDEPASAADEVEQAVREGRLVELGGGGVSRTVSGASSRVPELLAPRLDELRSMGAGTDEPEVHGNLFGEEQTFLSLDLARALTDARTHNLGVSRADLAPRIADAELEALDADFDAVLFSDAEYEKVDRPNPVPSIFDPATNSFFTVGAGETRSRRARLSAGLRRRLDAGGALEASGFVERFDNETSGLRFTPDPAWRSGLSLTVEQPLLRGYGEEVTRGAVLLKENEVLRGEDLARAERAALSVAVAYAYWDLHEAWERLGVLERLALEGEEVERVLFERQSFDVAPSEYSDALATVEARRAELVRARLVVRRASDRLKAFVQSPDYAPGSEVLIRPADAPSVEPFELAPAESVARALRDRPELRAALAAIDDSALRERIADNLEAPDLSFIGAVSVLGEDDGLRDASGELDDFLNYVVGLSFELPVGNRAARAEARRARLLSREAVLVYEQTALDVVLEVKAALRELDTSHVLIDATRALRIAQAENLRTLLAEEEVRSEQTPEFLALKFQRQERLAQARLDEIAALADYNRALAAYERAVGAGADGR